MLVTLHSALGAREAATTDPPNSAPTSALMGDPVKLLICCNRCGWMHEL